MTKKYYCSLFLVLAVLFLPAVLNAATITVNSAGGADYATINGALAVAAPNDTINIIGGGPYDETIFISIPVTLQGFGYRPILCVQANAAATTANACLEMYTNGTVNLSNLTIIPSRTVVPVINGVGVSVRGPSTVGNLDNLLICPNNGADAPVTTDGLSLVDLTGATPFVQPVVATRTGGIANLTNVIISNNRTAGAPVTQRTDGYLNYGSGGYSTIGEGCIISYNDGFGCQLNSACQIKGSASKPVRLIGNCQIPTLGYGAITNFDVDLIPLSITIDYCIIDSNLAAGIDEQGGANLNIDTISHTIISNQTGAGILSNAGGGNKVFENVTFFNNAGGVCVINVVSEGFTASNVIFAGTGNQDSTTNAIQFSGSTFEIDNSAIVQSGPYSLATIGNGISGTGIVNQTAVITEDPIFASIDSTSADFLNVTNYAFHAAGPGGTPLTGGAQYTGTLPLILAPSGVIITMTPGGTKDFTASGGTNNFTWTLSNATVGSINTTLGPTVTFTAASAGSVDLTVSDPGLPLQQQTVTITVIPTSAPLFKDAESRKYIRFELFE